MEGSWIRPWGELTLGTEGALYSATYDLLATEAREVFEHQLELPARGQSGGAYMRWHRVFDERLGLDLGGRLDALRTQNLAGHGESGVALVASPKLGTRYLLSGSATAMASVTRGLRSARGVLGDPDRPPVQAWAFEGGGEHVRDQVSVDVSVFRVRPPAWTRAERPTTPDWTAPSSTRTETTATTTAITATASGLRRRKTPASRPTTCVPRSIRCRAREPVGSRGSRSGAPS